MIGYYVLCFQDVGGNVKTPFKGKIEVEYGNYWEISYKRKRYRVLKGACSTVPFKDSEHAKSDEYRKAVSKVAKVDESKATGAEKPKEATRKPAKKRAAPSPSSVGAPKRNKAVRQEAASRFRRK